MNSNTWVKCKINDICRIRRGASPRPIQDYISEQGIPWVKISDATSSGSRFIDSTNEYIKEDGKEKSRFIEKGTLILSNSATPGIPKIMGIDACVHDGWLIIDEFKNVTQEFLYYSFIYERDRLLNLSNGSVFRNLKTDIVKNYEINLPGVNEQKAIAKVLSDLDEKIETNNKINKKLEEMAQAIFKQWFVDFEFPNEDGKPYKSSGGEMVESELGMIPKGWEYKKLDDVLNTIEAGNRPKGGAGNLTEGIPSIGAENIIGLGKYDYSKEKFVTEDYFNSMKKGIVQSKDVLLYKDGAQLGRKTMFMDGFPHEKCCINSHVFILRSNNSISQSYLYFWLDQDYMTQNIINLNANSAQPGINQIQVKSLNILVPTKEIIEKFELTVNSLLDKLFVNCKENTKLANIRDTLLPKLMSGEIRVPID